MASPDRAPTDLDHVGHLDDLERRVPEPELMDDPEQAAAYSEADFAAAHQSVVTSLVARFPELADDTPRQVLDLGCGPGDVTVRVARALPAATITAIDGAEAMLALARRRIAAAGLTARITLERRHLPDEALGRRRFDVVVSNSLLHHLDDPAVLWRTVRGCAAPGAPVFVMDLLRPSDRATVAAMVTRYTEGEPSVLVDDFRNSLLAAYRIDEVRRQIDDSGLTLEVEAVSDRHLAAWGRA